MFENLHYGPPAAPKKQPKAVKQVAAKKPATKKKAVRKIATKVVAKRTITTKSIASVPSSSVAATPAALVFATIPNFTLKPITRVASVLKTQRRFFTPSPTSYLQDPKAVEQRVFDVLGRFDKVPKDKINSNSIFQKDLGLDSLDRVEVVLAIEEEFNTEFTDEQSDKFIGVSDVVDYIAKMPDVHQRTYKPDDL